MGLTIDAKSMLGTRSSQQDFYIFKKIDNMLVAVVCDGMGGLNGGTEASRRASILFKEHVEEASPIADIPAFLEKEAHRLDEAVFSIRDKKGNWMGAGTTIVAVIIRDNELFFLTVGDSLLFAVRGDEILPLNREHNYRLKLEEMVNCGALSKEGYSKEIYRGDALISYMGMGNVEIYDVNKKAFILENKDKLLLCTDGVTKVLLQEEIKEIVKKGDVKTIVDEIGRRIETAPKKSKDNATFLAICYEEDGSI